MASVQWQDSRLHLIGQINFDNANQLYQDGFELLKTQSQQPLIIDLAKLEQGNTLALAICVQWFRKYSNMRLINVPLKMLGIIKASHLEQMID